MDDSAASTGAEDPGGSGLDDGEPEEAAPAPARASPSILDNQALARLIGRVMRQDETALAILHQHLSGRVYALALHITRQIASAEEVTQDVFWQIWRQAPRFDAQRGSVMAWVLTLARSRALDAARAYLRDPLQSRRQVVDDCAEIGEESAADDPLDLLDAVRRDGQLHAVLASLDPLRRQLIALAFYRGLTQDEIASHTGLPLGTVKSHFRRTLAALQSTLGSELGAGRRGSLR